MTSTGAKPDADLAFALSASSDYLRVAEKLLIHAGYEKTAAFLRFQLEKNDRVLLAAGGVI